jgi:uncharacterized protein (DUF885 family)
MFSRNLIGIGIGTGLLLALAGCGQGEQVNASSTQEQAREQQPESREAAVQEQIAQSVEAFASNFIAHQPAMATSLNLSKEVGGDFQRRLPDYSSEGMQAFQRQMQAAAARLDAIETQSLTDKDLRHIEVNAVIARYYAGSANFDAGYIDTWAGHLPYIVNQINGPLIDIPAVLGDQQAVTSLAEAEDYLARLDALALMVTRVKAKVAADAQKGVILPQALFPNTLKFLTNFVAGPAAEHSLVTSLADKLDKIAGLEAAQKQALLQQASNKVDASIYPAYRDMWQFMHSLQDKAPQDVGIWAQPNGEAFYRHGIAYLADSSLSADAIHQLGLDEVTRITAQMDTILKANGYGEGSVGERLVALGEEPRFRYENSDAGRQLLLDDLSAEIAIIMEKAPQLFSTLPPQRVVVKRVPIETEAGASGGSYVAPALDGSRAGVFFINLKDMDSIAKYGLKTLTYHEAVPGHHFQIALNMQQTDIGLMRQNSSFNAFIEGWALYAEQVAFEMGMYEQDPFGNLGRLKAEAYRAARLVVDTGLHHKKWSRQQAISYFAEATGSTEAEVASAIDRYIAWPGQALGYKLGMLKLLELREKARVALGDKFDIRAFHDLMLLPGARPMGIVEADVKRWIAEQLNNR